MTHESANYFDGGCKKHQLSFPCIDCKINSLKADLAEAEKLSAEVHRAMQKQREAACPGHVDNGGFMYGHCKLCDAEL